MKMLKERTAKILRELYYQSPWRRYFFYRYLYMFNPVQLIFICQCLDKTLNIDGDRLEVGCAFGHTTVFLNKYLDSLNALKPYYCIDTFRGFTIKDMDYEKHHRNRNPNDYKEKFIVNKKKWVDYMLRNNELSNVKTFQADICTFDFEKNNIKKLSFCLLDVDLYLPVKAALEKVYPLLESGGIIVVDDCMPHEFFDGALQAYTEFIEKNNLPYITAHEKLGIIEKP